VHFPHVDLDEFIVMPNHVHGIMIVTDTVDAGAKHFSPLPQPNVLHSQRIPPSHLEQRSGQRPWGTSKTIGSVVRGFKIGVTKWMSKHSNVHNVWQRNYYEHIIRNERSLHRLREYIVNNPAQWEMDQENPNNPNVNSTEWR